jgi:hypothetical protein
MCWNGASFVWLFHRVACLMSSHEEQGLAQILRSKMGNYNIVGSILEGMVIL